MTETLKYTVIKKQNEIELRQYAEHIKAEVTIDAQNHKLAVERAFNFLAGYIFGNNVSTQKIAMTTPVTSFKSEKIAMTTPVTVSGNDKFTVAFIMPSAYTISSLPLPKDERVHLSRVPAYQMAAIRFSGYFDEEKIRRNKEKLGLWLKEAGLEPEGDFIIAGYSPPWVPRFIARNEVLANIRQSA